MTNHWRDLKNADVILINGANPAESHPVGFQWFMKAKLDPERGPGSGGGAKLIHADPRFTRTSAVADHYIRMRTGTDVAYFGGLINYVLQNKLYHEEYVLNYTNASFVVKEGYSFQDGLFSGYSKEKRTYDASTWAYENTAPAKKLDEASASGEGPATSGTDSSARRDINHERSVLNLMKKHYERYTPQMVETITGIPQADFMKVAKIVGEMGRPDKVMS
ncbi:MAG: molybdopterin-dependent oxidoreductase, partial [Candidatus Dormibacteraeota bacterium]|nr:molybdopterin-dependent oxidoreductase [Candidatus Dormibacteraeota bacterium]